MTERTCEQIADDLAAATDPEDISRLQAEFYAKGCNVNQAPGDSGGGGNGGQNPPSPPTPPGG